MEQLIFELRTLMLPLAAMLVGIETAHCARFAINPRVGRYYYAFWARQKPGKLAFCSLIEMALGIATVFPALLAIASGRALLSFLRSSTVVGLIELSFYCILGWAWGILIVVWPTDDRAIDAGKRRDDQSSKQFWTSAMSLLSHLKKLREKVYLTRETGSLQAQHADVLRYRNTEGPWRSLGARDRKHLDRGLFIVFHSHVDEMEQDAEWKHVLREPEHHAEALVVPLTIYLGRRQLYNELRRELEVLGVPTTSV